MKKTILLLAILGICSCNKDEIAKPKETFNATYYNVKIYSFGVLVADHAGTMKVVEIGDTVKAYYFHKVNNVQDTGIYIGVVQSPGFAKLMLQYNDGTIEYVKDSCTITSWAKGGNGSGKTYIYAKP